MKKLALLILFGFFASQTTFAQEQCQITATKGTTVDLNRTAECMENRYGIDEDFIRRGKKKEQAPTVEIHFDITTPKEGQKVTALAIPKSFRNASEDLYYTWYLLRTNKDTGAPLSTMAEAKELAMGIIARGEYDATLFGETYTADTDDDGFYASYGGNDGVGAKDGRGVGDYDDNPSVMFDEEKQIVDTDEITRCYRHNFGIKVYDTSDGNSGSDNRAGRDQIINCVHEFPSPTAGICPPGSPGLSEPIGDGEFGLGEEYCWGTDPNNPDTDGDGIEDEADLAGLNQSQFTWRYREGDHVGVVIEGTSMIPISEGGTDLSFTVRHYSSNQSPPYFATYEAAAADCASLLEDNIDLGDASATGGTGGDPLGGGTGGSATVDLDADMSDYNDSAALYDACLESITQVWNPGVVVAQSGALNAYYKIMWGSPGICAIGDDSRTFMGGDHCSPGQGDVGFPYLEAVPVALSGGQILDPELDVIPENPQFDSTDAEKSDLITVSATTSNDQVDEDFIYYRWSVDKCDSSLLNCTAAANVEFESFEEGLGVKQLKFFPTAGTFNAGENKTFLQVTLIQSEHSELVGGSTDDYASQATNNQLDIGAIETAIVPVFRNDVTLRVFETQIVAGQYVMGSEICSFNAADPLYNVLYEDICPVHAYQVVAVQADVTTPGAGDRFSWQVNGEPIEPPFDLTIYPNAGVSDTDTIFLPVQAFDQELLDVSLTYKKDGVDGFTDIIVGRKLSANNPSAAIRAVAGAVPSTRYSGDDSLNVFEAEPGTAVTFHAEMIPNYYDIRAEYTGVEDLAMDPTDPTDDLLLGDDEVHLMWYLNGKFVGPDFIAEYPELGISIDNAVGGTGDITFTMDPDGIFGTGYELTTRIEKRFSDDQVTLLDDGWKILDTHTLTNDTTVTVRQEFNLAGFPSNPTLKQYLASSFDNAPHYLIFAMRLGVAMALVWFVLFGFSYAIQLNKEI